MANRQSGSDNHDNTGAGEILAEPRPIVAEKLLLLFTRGGIFQLILAANLAWTYSHPGAGVANSQLQLDNRIKWFRDHSDDFQIKYLDQALGYAQISCLAISRFLDIQEDSPLWTPEKARGGK